MGLVTRGGGSTSPLRVGDMGLGSGFGGIKYQGLGLNSYALLQGNDGVTYLNTAAGQDLLFRRNNVTTMELTTAALGLVALPVRLDEIADPAAPAADKALLYSRDNGAAKTQIVARFPTGAVQVIATEP